MKTGPIKEKWDKWLGQLRLEVLTLFLYRKLWRMYIDAAVARHLSSSG